MLSLKTIINNLQKNSDVDAVFLAGSHGVGAPKPHSDLDLVIILSNNTHRIRSVYQWIDEMFADIFFFDRSDLKRIQTAKELSGNSMDAIFISWLKKSDISFDKIGTITAMKGDKTLEEKCVILEKEKLDVWQKINCNFIANIRYFESKDSLYYEALEIRLAHSIIELITGYFTLHDIAWRGEKHAVQYLKKSDPIFYGFFQQYLAASNLQARFSLYKKMVERIFPSDYSLWSREDIIAVPQNENGNQKELVAYWCSLFS